MRDIRTDLQERLDAIGRDKDELQRRISESEILESAIKSLLKRESENFSAAPPTAQVERNFSSFGAKEAVSSFPVKEPSPSYAPVAAYTPKDARESVATYAAKDARESVASYAPKDVTGVVKASHWGELKVGS